MEKEMTRLIDFSHSLVDSDDGGFIESDFTRVDLSLDDEDIALVRVINHFIRFLASVGFDISVLPATFKSVIEAYKEDGFEFDEEELNDPPKMRKDYEAPSPIDIDKEQFETEVFVSKQFRSYLYELFQEDNER